MPRETGEPLEPPRSDVQIGAADTPGSPTGLTCPECHGVPWVGPDASALHSISLWRGAEVYHCRVGHSYSIETLREQQALAVEQALWAAVRSLREQAPVSGHIASRAEQRGTHSIVARYRERQSVANQHADVLEAMLSEPEEVGAETTQTPSRLSLACRPRPPRSAG